MTEEWRGGGGGGGTLHYMYKEIGPRRVKSSSVREIFHNPRLNKTDAPFSRWNAASQLVSQISFLSC